MTSIAGGHCLIQLMTVNTPFHLQSLRKLQLVLLPYIAVASGAFNLCRCVLAMGKKYEVRQSMKPLRWNRPLADIHVTGLTLCHFGKRSQIPAFSRHVTPYALQFQRQVFLVVKRALNIRRGEGYGKAKATKESEYVSLYLLPPPAAIRTYCFFVFLE